MCSTFNASARRRFAASTALNGCAWSLAKLALRKMTQTAAAGALPRNPDNAGEAVMKLAVDLIIRRGNEFLFVARKFPPFEGKLALPGGFVEESETVEVAAARELKEETGVEVAPAALHMVGVYSDPKRDPRGRVVSIAFFCEVPMRTEAYAGDDAAQALWLAGPKIMLSDLAFDHDRIMLDVARRWDVIQRNPS